MLRSLVLSAALYILCCATAFAQIPRQISYQGLILTQNNKPIADGTHSMTFIIKDGSGAVQYTGTQTVTTKGGIFSANIGPIPNGVDFGQQYFLSVQIEGTDIIPATAFTTAPYAFHAEIANGLTPNATGVVTSVNETSGGIRIVGDSTVGITQSGQTITLHSFAVGPGGSGGVQSVQSPEKTIDIKFPNGPLTSLDVKDSSLTTKKLVNGAVTAAKLNQSGATQGQVLKWNGTTWAPADEAGGSSNVWSLDGNQNTVAGVHFVGTTDSMALDLRSKNIIMLRLNPNNSISRDAAGNDRGIRAIDMQVSRSAATQVASGGASVIAGGEYNTSSGQNSVVGGGVTNVSSNSYSTVAGGGNNSATNVFATVSGGGHNTASNTYSTIGGGQNNGAVGSASTIGGGVSDTATAYGSTIAGGTNNHATGTGSTVGGGDQNSVNDYYSVVSGGTTNRANGFASSIGGGYNGSVVGDASTISGGYNNSIVADGSTIAGGAFMRMAGSGSFGFNSGAAPADSVVITNDSIAYFGNANLWLGNTNNKPSELRFYEGQNGGPNFPAAATNYTSFKAGAQGANIAYTLPTSIAPVNGSMLLSSTTGALSWTTNAIWDATNSRFGANVTSPNTTVDVNGDLSVREFALAVGNGMNNNLNIGAHTFIQLGGANGAFSISGIAGGTSGKMVIIYNSTGQAMTLSNNDPLSVAGNRIFNGSNQNYVTPNGAAFDVVTLIYSTAKNGWLIVSHN